jgi:opacity protein-like surface antigen
MRFFFLLICLFLGLPGHANKLTFLNHPVISFSGGLGWNTPGKTQTLFLQEGFDNTYQNYSSSQVLGFGELFFGVEHLFFNEWNTALGFIVSGAGMPKVNGEIWQFSDPEFSNFYYSYKLNQLRLGLRGKLIADQVTFLSGVKPFFTGSLALARNHSFSYQNAPLIEEAVAPNPFKDNTVSSFSYSLGVGLEKNIATHFKFGISYEFFDWGSSSLGLASGQTTTTHLGMSHLYVNTLLFSLSYLI